VTQFILEWIAWGGYLGIFLLMALENIIPPIPSEVIMGLGGMAVARGHMALWSLVAVGTAGSVAGNWFWYWIGDSIGYRRLRPFVERHGRWLTLTWSDVERVDRFFTSHGQWVIFVFRFLPVGRTIISLPAGMTHMPAWRFLLWTAAGAAIWNTVLASAGLYLGSNFRELDRFVGPVAVAIGVVMAVWYLWRVATWKPDR
jgi:membrane protein DedA with SNARE-associated domain